MRNIIPAVKRAGDRIVGGTLNKTGAITIGRPIVTDLYANHITGDELLRLAA